METLSAIGDFLFNTYAGLGCLVGGGLLISFVACFVTERNTRARYADRPEDDEDDWADFDDEDE